MADDSLHARLGLPDDAALMVQALHVVDWGRTLVFDGVDADGAAFVLRLDDCREMRWRVYAFESTPGEALIVDFKAGRDQHRSPLHILTSRFGLSVYYGALHVERRSQ